MKVAATATTTTTSSNIFNGLKKTSPDLKKSQKEMNAKRYKSAMYAPCNFKGCVRVYYGGCANSNLLKHQKNKHKGQKYHCHFCSNSFDTSMDLSNHQDKYCVSEKIYTCTICQCRCEELKYFNYHNQTCGYHQCSLCPMICHSINAMKKHTKTH